MIRAAAGGLVALLAAGVMASTASASPGRFSVGLAPGADAEKVAAAVAAETGAEPAADLGELRAVVFEAADVDGAVEAADELPGVAYAEPVTVTRTLSFAPADELADDQWYLEKIRAFDFWATQQPLPPVLVAVVDSGIDGTHTELDERIEKARSFVATPARLDTVGHGTAVAGEIAATLDVNGIAGVGIDTKLLVAKVVEDDGAISVESVAGAIRWAVDNGAQVINLSLGGPDYSALEHSAVDYATKKGVVVVAAAGNDYANRANYPAALPHVIGVGATNSNDRVPDFSNRDEVHVDLAAPGVNMLSTYPVALSTRPGCTDPGYTRCALDEVGDGPNGTSFASPLVAAGAALLLAEALVPLHSSQVVELLERNARDIEGSGRDWKSGGGLLNVTRALGKLDDGLPARDRFEPNDGIGERAATLRGPSRTVNATVTRYEDPVDVYRVRIRRGQRLVLRLSGPATPRARLALWRPGTPRVGAGRTWRAASATKVGTVRRISFRAAKGGHYYATVRGRGGAYELTLRKRS